MALEDDTVVLAIGGWPDRAYHSLLWEPIYLAQEPMRQGDWAGVLETLERELASTATRPLCGFGWPAVTHASASPK